jgi:hypothetical protein
VRKRGIEWEEEELFGGKIWKKGKIEERKQRTGGRDNEGPLDALSKKRFAARYLSLANSLNYS